MLRDLNTSIPIYVTRQNAHGLTGTWRIPAWMLLLSIRLVFFNIFIWGIIGLVEAVKYFL